MTRTMKCPICKKQVQAGDPDFPFCSERCRLIDLGKWSSGDYVISSPLSPDDLDELMMEAEANAQLIDRDNADDEFEPGQSSLEDWSPRPGSKPH